MLSLIIDEVITWGYKVIPRLDGVITLQPWGYNPGVFGVIDAELSELWGYKVIPRVDGVITLQPWGYNPGVFGVIDAELSELQGYNSIPWV